MSPTNRIVLLAVLEASIVCGLMLAAVGIVWLEALHLGQQVPEWGYIESAHLFLLLTSAGLVALRMRSRPDERGFLALLGGLFLSMATREADWLFHRIAPGAWVYFALAVAGISIAYALRRHDTIIPTLVRRFGSKAYCFLLVGLLIVLLFSRLFGTKEFWVPFMGDLYRPELKSRVQEGVELLGYVLVFYGTVLLCRRSCDGRPDSA